MKAAVAFAVLVVSLATSARADAALLFVPMQHATIQDAVDAAEEGDAILVGPGEHCGAVVATSVHLIGAGASIVGCQEPVLFGRLRVGFVLDGELASGSSVRGFRFDGAGIASDNLEPLAFAVYALGAHGVVVAHNQIEGTVQGITNTDGDGWSITANRIRELTLFDCAGGLCGGGAGIVVQKRTNDGQLAWGNLVSFNDVAGEVPALHGAFAMDGITLYGQERPRVVGNRLHIDKTTTSMAPAIGIHIASDCCGGVPLSATVGAVVINNDGRQSELVLVVETGNAADGMFVRNRGVSSIEGVVSSTP